MVAIPVFLKILEFPCPIENRKDQLLEFHCRSYGASPSVVGNTVEETTIKISGEVAKSDIGIKSENYLGRVCGRVLDSSASDKTQLETIVKDNIVK